MPHYIAVRIKQDVVCKIPSIVLIAKSHIASSSPQPEQSDVASLFFLILLRLWLSMLLHIHLYLFYFKCLLEFSIEDIWTIISFLKQDCISDINQFFKKTYKTYNIQNFTFVFSSMSLFNWPLFKLYWHKVVYYNIIF